MSNNKSGKTNGNGVGDKDISNHTVDNNNNGKEIANKENPYNLTGKAYENWKKNQEFIAKKSRYITSTNSGDKPRTFLFNAEKIESTDIEGDPTINPIARWYMR